MTAEIGQQLLNDRSKLGKGRICGSLGIPAHAPR
jgi:hypothetical protein